MSDETVPAPPKKATANDVAQLVLTIVLFASLFTMMAAYTTTTIRYAAQVVGGTCMFLRLPVQMYLARTAPFYRVLLSAGGFVVAVAGLSRLFNS